MIKAILVFSLLASPALAADHQMVLSDQDVLIWQNIPGAMDRCIGALVLRRDAAVCQELAPFFQNFADRVKQAPAIEPPKPVDPSGD